MKTLVWSDMQQIFGKFQEENLIETLPVRGFLQHILNGSIRKFTVSVDRWPDFSAVICCQDMAEFETPDWDFATIYARNSSASRDFFLKLAREKRWTIDRNVVFAGVDSATVETIRSVLRSGRTRISGPFNLVTAEKMAPAAKSEAERQERYEQLLKTVPSQYRVDRLRSEEASFIASFWDYYFPNKTAYFKFMIEKLPQACIRDAQTGQPVTWSLQYQIGAGAARYTLPAHRRLGLSKYLFPAIGMEHARQSSVPYYGDIAVDNEISLLSVKNHLVPSDFYLFWLFWGPNSAVSKI